MNNDNLQKISNYAEAIGAGKARYTRFTKNENIGLRRGGRIHAEASLIAGRSAGTGETSVERNRRQENDVEDYAKEKGIWSDNTSGQLAKKYGEPIDSGEESSVYYDGKNVVKSMNLSHFGNLQKAFDGITLHNTYFPETSMKVTGFGRDEEGEFQIIIEQPHIQAGDRKPTLDEVRQLAEEKGFHHVYRHEYSNDQTILEDLRPKNVIRSKDGKLFVIDSDMYLNTPDATGFGGTTYNGKRETGNDAVLNED